MMSAHFFVSLWGIKLAVSWNCRMLTRVRRTSSTSPVENSLTTTPKEGEMDQNEKIKIAFLAASNATALFINTPHYRQKLEEKPGDAANLLI
nr:hypothetical protein [Escherichia coli]